MKRTALVVDDDFQIQEMLRFVPEDKGLEVVIAGDGEEGLAKFGELAPAIIFVDLKMPKIDGLELLEQVKGSPRKTVTVLITGYPNADVFRGLFQVGADYYTTKPFRLITVNETVDEIIQSFEVQQAASA